MTKEDKLKELKAILTSMEKVIVAYSGGVDSAFLLKVAFNTLGNSVQGIFAVSPSVSSREIDEAKKTAKLIGARLDIIETKETENEKYIENPVNRCYFCKSELFTKISEIANTTKDAVMVDGSNFDDLGDHRPGMKALKEQGVRSPLQEAKLTKQEIRELSKEMGLPTWNKDALACLSSRFPYGEKIYPEKLKMVDEIENFLYHLGFHNIRARHKDKTLKIEVDPSEIQRLFDDSLRQQVVVKAKSLGYAYVTLDLEGYRRGSMNEVVRAKIASQ